MDYRSDDYSRVNPDGAIKVTQRVGPFRYTRYDADGWRLYLFGLLLRDHSLVLAVRAGDHMPRLTGIVAHRLESGN
jgi:hypothetical protein